jgi:GST-like protein
LKPQNGGAIEKQFASVTHICELSLPETIMIDLYSDATPNGLKVSIALDELSMEYTMHRVYLGGDQFTPEFTALNPNNKIPVLVDNGLVLSESGAILLHLAEKTGRLLPASPAARARAIEMLMFQMASLGPMFGQYLVFAGAWQNRFPEVTTRYFDEVSRIMRVLETRLADGEYLAGAEYSIADIACFPWIRLCLVHPLAATLGLEQLPRLFSWYERVAERPAVQSGLTKPEPFPVEQQQRAFIAATVGLGHLHRRAA